MKKQKRFYYQDCRPILVDDFDVWVEWEYGKVIFNFFLGGKWEKLNRSLDDIYEAIDVLKMPAYKFSDFQYIQHSENQIAMLDLGL